jgi:hypothetical protein
MRITDDHIATYKRRGYSVVERFLSDSEVASAMSGLHRIFAPTFEDYRLGKQMDRTQQLFPWDDSGLNAAATHPELIRAAERIIGTRDVRLADSDINVRYAGELPGDGFHIDFGNNTLGPELPEDHSNITLALVLTEVQPGMAPTRMVPWGAGDDQAEPMCVPAGSLIIYSTMTTRHSASNFTLDAGLRATMWTIWCRQDRPWEGRSFTHKSCGGQKYQALCRFIAEASPRQLEMIGFPPPGHPLWTREYIAGMAKRYPGFRASDYFAAIPAKAG